jgi:hypothetical protein
MALYFYRYRTESHQYMRASKSDAIHVISIHHLSKGRDSSFRISRHVVLSQGDASQFATELGLWLCVWRFADFQDAELEDAKVLGRGKDGLMGFGRMQQGG